jgi:hypothetical protein
MKVPSTEDLCFNPFSAKIDAGDYLCRDCYRKYVEDIYTRYNRALESYNEVHTYPATYQGKIPVIDEFEELKSDFYRYREMALQQLKVSAIFLGYNIIYDVTYNSETQSDDNYTYSIWCASGKAAIKRE